VPLRVLRKMYRNLRTSIKLKPLNSMRHCEERSNPRLYRVNKAKCECHVVSLIAAKGYFFCLDTKETKSQVSRNASLPHRPLPCNSGKTWAGNFCAIVCAQGPCTAKVPLCPAITHKATIVLPDFIRSCSTDGEKKSIYYT
jgi:hypothetical protein